MKMTRRQFILGSTALAGTAMVGGTAAFLHTPQFGRKPSKKRLARIMASPNWSDGAFRNYEPFVSPPPQTGKPKNRLKLWWDFLLADKSALAPKGPLPTVKTDLKALDPSRDLAVWMGHSTIYMQLGGKRILIDPVFSDFASPVWFINRAFDGVNIYSADDFPKIDILAITHDHWDHLDYPTINALLPKIRRAICPLGVGEYLEQWGVAADAISEGDWFDEFDFDGLRIAVTPARHFSGRLTRPNQTLWGGFAFRSQKRNVLVSGDGGFGAHIQRIATAFAPFDFAFLENGQYNVRWPSVHTHPHETAQVADIIGARYVVPTHNSKFTLSNHAWNTPMTTLAQFSAGHDWRLLTPRIGDVIDFAEPALFPAWYATPEA